MEFSWKGFWIVTFLGCWSFGATLGQVTRSAVIYHNSDIKCSSLNELPPLVCVGESVIKIKRATFGGNHVNPQCARCDQSAQCRRAAAKPLTHTKTLALYQACSGQTSCVDYLSLFDGDAVWTEYKITYECVRETKLIDICSAGSYGPENEVHIVYDRFRSTAPSLCTCSVTTAPTEQVSIELTDVRLSNDVTQCGNTSMRFQQGQYEIEIGCRKNAGYLGVRLPVAYKTKTSKHPALHIQLRNVSVTDPPQRYWVTLTSKGNLSVECNKVANTHEDGMKALPAISVQTEENSSKLGLAIGIPVAVILIVVVIGTLLFIAYRKGFLPFTANKKPDVKGTNNNGVGPSLATLEATDHSNKTITEPNSVTVRIPVCENDVPAESPSSSGDKESQKKLVEAKLTRPHKAPPPPPPSASSPPAEGAKVRIQNDDDKGVNQSATCGKQEPSGDIVESESIKTSDGDQNDDDQKDDSHDNVSRDDASDGTLDDANATTNQLWNQVLANQTTEQDNCYENMTLTESECSDLDHDLYNHTQEGKFFDEEQRTQRAPENVYSHVYNKSDVNSRKGNPLTESADVEDRSSSILTNNNVTYINVKNDGKGDSSAVVNGHVGKDGPRHSGLDTNHYNKIWDYSSGNGESIDSIEDTGENPMVEAFL